jgi:hypothetical protein
MFHSLPQADEDIKLTSHVTEHSPSSDNLKSDCVRLLIYCKMKSYWFFTSEVFVYILQTLLGEQFSRTWNVVKLKHNVNVQTNFMMQVWMVSFYNANFMMQA